MNFGIVCACLPAVKPLLKHYFPNIAIFDPNVERRLTMSMPSFRLSNRVARFGSQVDPSSIDDTTSSTAARDGNMLRTKPSAGSGSSEDEKTRQGILAPSSNVRSVDSGV